MALHYNSGYDDCSICNCDKFEAGYVERRLKDVYWPRGTREPDFEKFKEELKQRYGIEATIQEIKEHWDLHVSHRLDDHRKRSRENAEHGIAETRYDPENDE